MNTRILEAYHVASNPPSRVTEATILGLCRTDIVGFGHTLYIARERRYPASEVKAPLLSGDLAITKRETAGLLVVLADVGRVQVVLLDQLVEIQCDELVDRVAERVGAVVLLHVLTVELDVRHHVSGQVEHHLAVTRYGIFTDREPNDAKGLALNDVEGTDVVEGDMSPCAREE